MRVIIAGGGTGGHLYPGVAVAEYLRSREVEFLFLVSDRGIDREILSRYGYEFYEQQITAFKGKGFIEKIKSLFRVFLVSLKVSKFIKKHDKVLLLGGFAAVPAGIVSIFKRCDLYLHEQNSVMGIANRFLAKFAKKVFLSFDNTKNAAGRCIVVGNPVRKEFKDFKVKDVFNKHIFVTGGSQGSRIINNVVCDAASKLLEMGYSVIHQTGTKLYDETIKRYRENGIYDDERIKIYPFIEDMAEKFKWADIVISRSGAGSVFEILYSKRIGIFVPLKIAADNHQYFNALYVKEKGAGEIILEDEFNPDSLIEMIKKVENEKESYLKALEGIEFKDSAKLICEELLSA
ncbi:undecaprenyldiphospho-muramoylpentapeptide beta-N-acetylglucosaminyltransferase [Deferribacter autotrophicus]|uniref:UDP-N-acetylglucosamine--N-acetylmuramyl-(pentapeptide) pyrophosphoryl-undecaprenol N-acetylglucosamine transferase n=1 Tax=Deferribacter autotrophicus TaxID=500465 RepID=A0A5A8F288_9BACT|nr:undecaprenyldiphospho-muramoylpentapeptide beta-N-acetylglucosaminyltransferase [Deferribacter autotrophicus]KAA0257861.1 undecaprenyldiphospho-muramoylpentapeptide beta-N-acetylglucosaminyltransferase [Deferribacter autotrophicus]